MRSIGSQEPKLHAPSLRSALIKIHADLFKIDRYVLKYSAYQSDALTNVEKLIIVLEDRRFLEHIGIDARSVVREVIRAGLGRRHGGASTIDMQFVRTVTEYKRKTLQRKLYEIFLAVIIQFRYSKIMILRSYLNCAFFGSHLIGINKVSKKLFCKNPEDLTIEEAAMVAAMLVYPMPLTPTPRWRINVDRRADYGISIYVSNKERFDKLPG